MIPEQEWGTAAAQRFFNGLTDETAPPIDKVQHQKIACLRCYLYHKKVNTPDILVVINAESLCLECVEVLYPVKQPTDVV